ncbi:hypothetical protein fh0823_24060 [Francisella halioticida]|uniref:hypothetical protein n=1 Tax=Francisella halioticida TaxID=549298 RepID=UPI001AFB3CEB|nr:hypothetical protein [Francisella halioticida]BCD92267.1 hypothetical protein fh0823_24060 [Francisella halioticida]
MSDREKRLETFRKSQTKRSKTKKEKGYVQLNCWVKEDTKKTINEIKKAKSYDEMGEVLDFTFKKSHV